MGYLLNYNLMRKMLILGLALSVFAAGLMPLSACALLTSKGAECAEAAAPSPCDQMYSRSAETQVSKSSGKSCCFTSQAPLPELQFKGIEVGPALATTVSQNTLAIPITTSYSTLLVVEHPSPPSLQSLLCTFLI